MIQRVQGLDPVNSLISYVYYDINSLKFLFFVEKYKGNVSSIVLLKFSSIIILLHAILITDYSSGNLSVRK